MPPAERRATSARSKGPFRSSSAIFLVFLRCKKGGCTTEKWALRLRDERSGKRGEGVDENPKVRSDSWGPTSDLSFTGAVKLIVNERQCLRIMGSEHTPRAKPAIVRPAHKGTSCMRIAYSRLAPVILFLGVCVVGTACQAADAPTDQTALDRYIAKPDPAYHWKLAGRYPGHGQTTYVIALTSQTWRTPTKSTSPSGRIGSPSRGPTRPEREPPFCSSAAANSKTRHRPNRAHARPPWPPARTRSSPNSASSPISPSPLRTHPSTPAKKTISSPTAA